MNPKQALDTVFEEVRDMNGFEPTVSGEKFNNFLSNDTGRISLLSPSEFSIITCVMNNCNLNKPQKINKNTFVNFFLFPDQRTTFDQYNIMNRLLDISKNEQVDQTVLNIFRQTAVVDPKEIFDRSFNSEHRIKTIGGAAGGDTSLLARTIGGMFGNPNQPKAPLPGAPNPNKPLNAIVFSGEMKMSNIDSYQPVNQIPEYNRGFTREDLHGATHTHIQQRTTHISQQGGHEDFAHNANSAHKHKEHAVLPLPGTSVKSTPMQPQIFSYFDQTVMMPDDYRPPRVRNTHTGAVKPADPSVMPQPSGDNRAAGGFSADPLDQQQGKTVLKDVDILNESSFANYQEVVAAPDTERKADELRYKMDANVRNNLKKFEYDF